MPTVRHTLTRIEAVLSAAGISSPAFDARCLVAEVLFAGDLGRLPLERSLEVTEAQADEIDRLAERRRDREPLQYILGYTEFVGLRIKCDPRALIPRPETELLAETVIAAARTSVPRVAADVGTGTGALAVALGAHLPQLQRIYATDISPETLALAGENVAAHGLQARTTLLEGADLRPLWDAGVAQRIELLVTNPPYISAEEVETLQPEVRVSEPRVALVDQAGSGLGFYQRVIPQLAELSGLRLFACEVGAGMAADVEGLTRSALRRWQVRTVSDYSGFARIVVAHAP
jgi:release factor glutamine methyltransferase